MISTTRRYKSVKPTKQFEFKEFKGIDQKSSPIEVNPSRCVKMLNFINDNGYNHLRKGKEIILDEKLANIGRFKNSLGTTLYITLIKPNTLRVTTAISGGSVTDTETISFTNDVEFYQLKDDLYIVSSAGIYVYRLRTPNDLSNYVNKAYIPTTSINEETLEEGNILTNERINHFTFNGEDLDTLITDTTLHLDKDIYSITGNNTMKVKLDGYFLKDGVKNKKSFYLTNILHQTTTDEIALCLTNSSYASVTYSDDTCVLANQIGETTKRDESGREWLFTKRASSGTTFPSVFTDGDWGDFKLTDIYFDYKSNSTVNTEVLTPSHSCVFGEEGQIKRLFLSVDNKVYYSAMDNFNYLPEYSYTEVGSEQSKITGFLNLKNNSLAIFKEQYNDEPTIYYMTPKSTYNEDGTYYRADFPVIVGTSGEKVEASVNFLNDNLIITKSGVYALYSTSETNYTRKRSSLLGNVNLTNVTAISFDNKLYISCDDGTYIADGRYKFQQSNLNPDDTFEYEWWKWDIVAKRFYVIENTLYFNDGDKLYSFNDIYKDNTSLVDIESGDLAVDYLGDSDYNINECILGGVQNATLDPFEIGSLLELDVTIGGHDVHTKARVTGYYGGDELLPLFTCDNKSELVEMLGQYGSCVATGFKRNYEPFDAYFETKVTDCGITNYSKTLKAITITPESSYHANFKVSYKTRASNLTYNGKGGESGYDYYEYDYKDYLYDGGFFNSYRKVLKEKDFNYIVLRITSNGNGDCAINKITLEFKVNSTFKGVR